MKTNHKQTKHAYIHLFKRAELLEMLLNIETGKHSTFTKNQILTYLNTKK